MAAEGKLLSMVASQDENGNLGDFEEVADLLDTTTIINGLAMDALYAFKAKVRC